MAVVTILLVVMFDIVLCIFEIPSMIKNNLKKEMWFFSILLSIGTVLAVLKSLDVNIPNPTDWVMKAYAPIVDIMKNVLE